MTTATKGRFGLGSGILFILAALGIILALYRFAVGIGAVSNLSQGYPWGFWIGCDVLAGIALAAGGFVVAAIVHIFGGEKYHPLVRPAIWTAFLGYLLFIFALLVDLGRPWVIWHQIIYWHPESPMFEVGFCVMFYTTVLFLEFLPIFFERFKLTGLHKLWLAVTPWIAILLLVGFAALLTHRHHNWGIWVFLLALLLVIFELAVRGGALRRDPRVPTLLIMAGIIFSTLHQSSLGTLFLLAPHKLSVIWWSPALPVMFFISAVMVGLAMLIVEGTLSAWFFGRKVEIELLQGIGKGLSWVLLLYLAVRGVDLVVRGVGSEVLVMTTQSLAFWGEIIIGLLIPLAILLTAEGVKSSRGLFWAGLLTVIGLIMHRYNVAVTGIHAPAGPVYYPHWMEVAITVGVVSAGILVYLVICKNFPVLEDEHAQAAHA